LSETVKIRAVEEVEVEDCTVIFDDAGHHHRDDLTSPPQVK
jgi:hypothetical protein